MIRNLGKKSECGAVSSAVKNQDAVSGSSDSSQDEQSLSALKPSSSSTRAGVAPKVSKSMRRAELTTLMNRVNLDGARSTFRKGTEFARTNAQSRAKMPPRNSVLWLDLDALHWQVADVKTTLFASAEPAGSEAQKASFYQFLSDENITCVIDLRPPYALGDHNTYYAEQLGSTQTFQSVKVSVEGVSQEKPDLNAVHVKVHFADHQSSFSNQASPEKAHALDVLHYLEWHDFAVIPSEDLRTLGDHLISRANANENCLVHCRGGIGRTGTLLTYAQVKRAIQNRENQALSKDEVEKLVAAQITSNRRERRSGCVETGEQERLIVNTLMQDFDEMGSHGKAHDQNEAPHILSA